MPTARPFALNTGSTISGTEQLGDLAIGYAPYDYTTNPGGVRWWGGPDEDPGYIICYPVYSQDRSSPDGPIGSVGFKRSKQKTEESFIQISENMSNFTETFTSGIEAKQWLVDNGYWTSYIGVSAYTPTCFTIDGGVGIGENAWDIEYSPTSQEIYLNNFATIGAYVIDSNTLQYKGTLPVTGTSGNGQFAIDLSGNKLFTGQVNWNYIVKYDLSGLPVSGRTIDAAAQPYSPTNNFFQIAYNPVHDKLYVANNDFRKLYILTGSNLSTIAEIDPPTPLTGDDAFNNVGVNTNNGNVITTFEGVFIDGQFYNYFIIDGDTNEITYTGYTGSGLQWDNLTKVIFSPVNNKFYLIQFTISAFTGKVIQVIDANTGEFIKTINLSNSSSNNQQTAIIYDSLRNYIWTPDRILEQWVVIDCNTDEIVFTYEETLGCGGSYYGGLFATYDTLNDRMVVTAGSSFQKKYFELSEIIPYPVFTPTPTPTQTTTPTPTPSQTVTQTPTQSVTPTPTQSVTSTPTPTPSSAGGGVDPNGLFVSLDASTYTSGTWNDSSGNGNNATVNGATWSATNGGIFDFDGINDTISIPHNSSLSLSTSVQRTVQVWVNIDTLPALNAQVPIFGKLSSSFVFDGYWAGMFSNGGVVRCTTNGSSVQKISDSTSTITTGTWYLFTFISQITSTANTTKVYINTTEYITTAHGTDGYTESNPLYIGWIGSGVSSNYLNGKVGAFYFYTRGLSLSEVTSNFNATKSKYGL